MQQKHIFALALVAVLAGAGFLLPFSETATTGLVATVSEAFKGIFARIPSSKLELWLPFDEGEGAVARDASRNLNTGELIGDPAWVSGVGNSALSFDGADDFVRIPYDESYGFSTRFTLAAWLRLSDEAETGGAVLSRRGAEAAAANSTALFAERDRIRFVASGEEVVADVSLPANEWVHVALTYHGGSTPNTVFYVDGIQVAGANVSSPQLQTEPLFIGSDAEGSDFFRGDIDELKIYKQQLLPREVAELYLAEWPQE